MTAKNYALRDRYEAETHRLFDFDWVDLPHGPRLAVLRLVWRGMYHAAMPLEQVAAIARAVGPMSSVSDEDWRAALDQLVKMKVLRRYKKQGRALYEVNF